ncbi:unnamed protein product [Adineta ricciae]|uniref:Transmembrane protein n=1 Tax=Adineta ricciae TaxID=249248 RepID=A0A815M5J3_ADIRI|nr:unnamed protein product [Adineta ricciae]CAF1415905.1 unnamed protein product [Adineta ricciae]
MAKATEELLSMITKETKTLLAEIHQDIQETKALTDDDRTKCMKICQQVENEHKRLKIQFLNQSISLIGQALETSDPQKILQIRQAWALALENLVRQCRTIACPLLELLGVLSRQDAKLGKKYAGLLTGAVLSSCLCGAAIVVLIAHYHPGCCFQLAAEAVLVVAGGALLAIAVAVGCITGCVTVARLRTVYSKCSDSVRLMLVSCFPCCFDGSTKDPNEAELASIIEKAINTLNIKEDTWFNRPALEMLKGSAETERDHLTNS